MKIVIKHVDNLNSTMSPTRENIPQYLVYLMTNDNIAISCDIVNGRTAKSKMVDNLQVKNNFTLPVLEVSYNEFKNNVLQN